MSESLLDRISEDGIFYVITEIFFNILTFWYVAEILFVCCSLAFLFFCIVLIIKRAYITFQIKEHYSFLKNYAYIMIYQIYTFIKFNVVEARYRLRYLDMRMWGILGILSIVVVALLYFGVIILRNIFG
jgi:hypothetical protein